MGQARDVADNRVDVEDKLSGLEASIGGDLGGMEHGPVERTLVVGGESVMKSRVLAMYSCYRKTASSTDCLKRVQEVARYVAGVEESTSALEDDANLLLIHNPVATLIQSDKRIWLALGKVNGIRYNNQSVERVGTIYFASLLSRLQYRFWDYMQLH